VEIYPRFSSKLRHLEFAVCSDHCTATGIPVTIGHQTGRVPEPVWTLTQTDESPNLQRCDHSWSPCHIRIPIHPLVFYPLGYTTIKLQHFAVERTVLFTFLIILSASFKIWFLDSKANKNAYIQIFNSSCNYMKRNA
jgi:hypothetical protein